MIEPLSIIGEINAQLFREFIDANSDEERLRSIHQRQYLISSPGGDIGYMLALFDWIRAQKADTIGCGLLQSAAAVLLQAGKKRTLTVNALLVFHEPKVDKTTGEIPDAQWRLHSQLMELVAARTGVALPEVATWFDNTFINADRALSLGLIDEIAKTESSDDSTGN